MIRHNSFLSSPLHCSLFNRALLFDRRRRPITRCNAVLADVMAEENEDKTRSAQFGYKDSFTRDLDLDVPLNNRYICRRCSPAEIQRRTDISARSPECLNSNAGHTAIEAPKHDDPLRAQSPCMTSISAPLRTGVSSGVASTAMSISTDMKSDSLYFESRYISATLYTIGHLMTVHTQLETPLLRTILPHAATQLSVLLVPKEELQPVLLAAPLDTTLPTLVVTSLFSSTEASFQDAYIYGLLTSAGSTLRLSPRDASASRFSHAGILVAVYYRPSGTWPPLGTWPLRICDPRASSHGPGVVVG
ncbi:hypothetical protein MSAN_00970000 [Mycena sanguinolenta]|uniref:Uncharacterized protein n=1 Tax=Mycena sanguinolenta TaxID=230812 RepID=A0A8H7D9D2_9AGAR|nr:hypothetical protein MSAN_00970000 [Mycena sanguinolenta]